MAYRSCVRAVLVSRVMSPHRLTQSPRHDQRRLNSCFATEVRDALREGRGVVALESTIVAHGMPWPDNLRTAQAVEDVVRERGATPATVAIVKGNVRIGLETRELHDLAVGADGFTKASRRDLAVAVGLGRSAATTVSGTAVLAAAASANIGVFVTGGIGGVHRGGENTMDVSADLVDLARTPLMVVCAGAKSILDIPRTLEVLETHGVAVLGWRTDEFPAFFSRSSGGCRVSHTVTTAHEAALVLDASRRLGLCSGIVLAVPIPDEHAADGEMIEQATRRALAEADEQGVRAKDATPFVLRRINELTGGASLRANIELVKNNARVGADIACAYANLRADEMGGSPNPLSSPRRSHRSPMILPVQISTSTPQPSTALSSSSEVPRVIVVGGVVLDTVATGTGGKHSFSTGTSNVGTCSQALGGVGKNVAEAATRRGVPTLLISAVGSDVAGDTLISAAAAAGMRTDGIAALHGRRSGAYVAVHNPAGGLVCGVADMDVFNDLEWESIAHRHAHDLAGVNIVAVDTNISVRLLANIAAHCANNGINLFVEPTSDSKCVKCVDAGILPKTTYIKPNERELAALVSRATGIPYPIVDVGIALEHGGTDALIHELGPQVEVLVSMGVGTVMTSLGKHGMLVASRAVNATGGGVDYFHLSAPHIDPSKFKNSNGAGDTFVGVTIAALATGITLREAVTAGMAASALSCQSEVAVSTDITPYHPVISSNP